MVEDSRRKLAAILSADVAGYGKLMADDERATVDTLKEYRVAIARVIERHKGRVVNAPGDNILADFPSAVEAVQGACEIQQVLKGRNLELPAERRMEFRIGVNLGDVIEEADGTIYGDGVNIAARMEALAEIGGICISNTVYDAVEGKLDYGFDFLGEQPVKNIPRPVRVYRVRAEPGAAPSRPVARPRVTIALIAVAVVVALAVAGVVAWRITQVSEPAPEQVAEEDPRLVVPEGPSIAVLPFANMSGDPDQEYFTDGISENIIMGLTRFPDLAVIARNSTFQYKDRAVDVRQVGAALGARYVLEGSVRRAGDQIRVTAQLIDARDGRHVWAETYDRDVSVGNIFDIQDEITGNVVDMIANRHGIIARVGLEQAKRKPTESLSAYECVLHAYQYLHVKTPELHLKARDCLERAVTVDPEYSEAWAWLAAIRGDEYVFGYHPRPDLGDPLDRALEAAKRAVALDPESATARFQLARTFFFRQELDQFFREIDIAVSLNSNDAFLLATSGLYLSYAGEWNRGVALIKKAAELNPVHPGRYHIPISWSHNLRGEYEEALTEAQTVNMPGFYWADIVLAIGYQGTGREAEARAAVADLQQSYPGFTLAILRDELSQKWNFHDDEIDRTLEILAEAGVPEGEPAR